MPRRAASALRLFATAIFLAGPVQASEAPACRYDVRFADPIATLEVDISCAAAAIGGFEMPNHGAAAWVRSFTLADGTALAAADGVWRLPEGTQSPVKVRYRLDLKGLAAANRDYDVATPAGGAILADPSSWLALPSIAGNLTLEIRFHPAAGVDVATAMPEIDGVHRFETDDMRFAGSTVFGHFDRRRIELPGQSASSGGDPAVIDLAILGDGFAASNDALAAWVHDTALVDAGFWQGFPARRALVILLPAEGAKGLPYGRVLNGAGVTMMIEVGTEAPARALYDEWVLVHELLHVGSPFIRDTGAWLNEGIATYIEPIVRYRAGWKTEDEVWREWIENMPRGADAMGPQGLASARGGGVYWGGALFLLLADVAIRERTQGERGVEDGLIALLRETGNVTETATTEASLAAADRAIGGSTLGELARRYLQPGGEPIDLEMLWRRLGVSLAADGTVQYDDTAPLARVRQAIADGGTASGPRHIEVSLP